MAEILASVVERNRAGEAIAVPSICTSHVNVIEICMRRAAELQRPLVVEATSNQVNQFGGYTGMVPQDFSNLVRRTAENNGLGDSLYVLGGDHLGPQAWRDQPSDVAMSRACEMVRAYVDAGFRKIHLDCSEGCANDPEQLDDEVNARRSARLAKECLEAARDPEALLFVVGTEVPPPGGARADTDHCVLPTSPEAGDRTLVAHRQAFEAAGIGDAWSQVAGLVVQPGVEFAPTEVFHLPMQSDLGFLSMLQNWPGISLEAHSTDYQFPKVYPRLAELGFAFQKVGPALTFAWREAVYGLDMLRTLGGWASQRSVASVMEDLMSEHPEYWRAHYVGTDEELTQMLHTSYADRIRYYWSFEEAKKSVDRLLNDLTTRTLNRPFLEQMFVGDVLDRAEILVGRDGLSQGSALIAANVEASFDRYLF